MDIKSLSLRALYIRFNDWKPTTEITLLFMQTDKKYTIRCIDIANLKGNYPVYCFNSKIAIINDKDILQEDKEILKGV